MARPSGPGENVQLGEHEYRIVPQRHAYLRRQLASFTEDLSNLGDLNVENMMEVLGDRVWELLRVFIPDLMERYEFLGYASPAAQEDDRYEPEADRSPSVPEVTEAFRIAIRVNGLGMLRKAVDFIGQDFFKAQMRVALSDWALSAQKIAQDSMPSESLPPQNGGSLPTPSTPSESTPPIPSPATT